MKRLIFLAPFLLAFMPMEAQTIRLLVGQYNKDTVGGIYALPFNTKTGQFGKAELLRQAPDPSFVVLSADGKMIAWSNETGQGKALEKTGLYWAKWNSQLNAQKTESFAGGAGDGANCHTAFSPDGQWLASAFYVGGKAQLVNLKTGERNTLSFSGSGPNKKRQEASHVHQTYFAANGDLWICDLGTDKVHRLLAPNYDQANMQTYDMPAGMGPRHLVLTKNGDHVYVLGELDGHVQTLEKQGHFYKLGERILAMNDAQAEAAGAEIALSADEQFLYTSHRGKLNELTVLKRSNDGRLSGLQSFASGGKAPRHFTISRDGKWVFVAHQNSNNIVAFRRNQATGALEKASETSHHQPVCLVEIL